ncbi:hypothetical protein FIV06_23875 [Labrenzia sp. THAF191b]|uniref:DUF3168 domain-containing protein n=1 Tax=unclassified Labrenzia TaxID=2648686 RepID=UPI0012697EAE|nr:MULTISPECIES: DUF3168 domain-containing protein [unclassified Labrenzia]QFT00488.1 hypothetical protein FIV06_23875 [Labrenzia sp. THAF191b]QFT06801.1 hypothetical protein FIV05_23870 [Labrenzia sp. THAF191a]QFT18345.1 hypothetical protein FIV03_23885 [Labrenzia sp. THAF187b]
MSAEAELQKLLVDTIKGNAGVMAIAGGCYDRPPKDPFKGKSAYVTLGSFEQLEDDSDCISGFEFTQTLNVWSKAVGGVECKNLASLLRRLLHRADLSLTTDALVQLTVERVVTGKARDGITHQSVMTLSGQIEEVV